MRTATGATLAVPLLAATAATLAWLVAGPGPRAVVLDRIGARTAGRRTGPPRPAVALAAGGAVLLALLAGHPPLLLLAVAAAVVAWTARDLRRRSRRRRDAAAREAAVAEVCDVLVAALGAGAPPVTALDEASRDHPFVSPVARAARLGGDVTAAWRACARDPGAADLEHVAAAWAVAIRVGAPLASTLGRVATSLREAQEARAEIEASLGPPRATARLLAGLPVLGLALGAGLGGDPLGAVTGSTPVAGCVLVGVLLAAVGLVWVDRVADTAVR